MDKRNLRLSIVITSYTMDRFKDIANLFDSIRNQTIISRKVGGQESAVPNFQKAGYDSLMKTYNWGVG